jgi:hypothetical protein
MSTERERPCFGCGHIHADGPGRCWEAACAPTCPANHNDYEPGVFPYTPDAAEAEQRLHDGAVVYEVAG